MTVVKNIKVNVDTKEAVSDVNKLDKSFKDLDGQTEKTSTGLKDVGENGGAIALLDSVTGGLATRFRDAYEATKLFNFSLKGTRTALIATGVGAFVVALGLIVAYWDDISDAIQGVTKKLEKQVRIQNRAIEKLEGERGLLDQLIELEGDRGDNAEDLLLQRQSLLLVMQQEVAAAILLAQAELESVKASTSKLTILERIAKGLRGFGFGAEGTGLITEEEEALIKEAEDELLRLQKLALQLQIDFKKITEKDEGDGVERGQQENALEDGLTPEDLITLGSRELLNEKLGDLDKLFKDEQRKRDEALKNEQIANALLEEQRAEDVKNAKIAIAGQTLNIIGMLAKEGSDLAKGIAASQATINTFLGVTLSLIHI